MAILVNPRMTVRAFSALTPFSAMSLIPMTISPIPWITFSAPPTFKPPSIIRASPTIPAKELIIPATFWKVGPLSRKSFRYLSNSFKSARNMDKPRTLKSSLKAKFLEFSSFRSFKAAKKSLATFHAKIPAAILVTVERTPFRFSFSSSTWELMFSKMLSSHSLPMSNSPS